MQDLAFWVQASDEDGIAPVPEEERVALGDVEATAGHLLRHTSALSGWSFAERMLDEMQGHASALENLTRPPSGRVLLGPCPVEIVRQDGSRAPCGDEVRADVDKASDVRCLRCGTTDTIEGWQRRMVGALGLVTADELARVLRRIGVSTTSAGIRQRVHRGSIPKPTQKDEADRWLHDAEVVLRVLMAREARNIG